jgi:hypothetical protein
VCQRICDAVNESVSSSGRVLGLHSRTHQQICEAHTSRTFGVMLILFARRKLACSGMIVQ